MGKRVLLAVNPRARRGQAARDRAATALRAHGHEVIVAELDGSKDGLSRGIVAHRDDVDVVAVGGGDGTLLTAIDGLLETKLPLLILPLGTFNEFARTLGIPHRYDAVAALVDRGVPLPVDVGRVNGRYYLNEASVGLSANVTRLQTSRVKKILGMLAVPITTLRALRYARPLRLEVEDDKGKRRRVRAIQLTVANSYRFGGWVENPEASLEDGRLWLYSLDVKGFGHTLGIIVAIALRRFQRTPDVMAVRGTQFVVRSVHGHPHRVYADSELVSTLPARFDTVPHGIVVMVPQDRVRTIR